MEQLVIALSGQLELIHEAITPLSLDEYAERCAAGFTGAIGAHVRHCVDHVTALLAGAWEAKPVVNYENRQRDSAVQSDRDLAMMTIRQLQQKLEDLKSLTCEHPVHCVMLVDAKAAPIQMQSTLGRETMYVISHTIHHNAILAAIIRTQNGSVPGDMGMAPSTLAYQRTQTCAR